MARTIRAVYDNGVLRLLEPVDLPEHRELSIVIVEDDASADAVARATDETGNASAEEALNQPFSPVEVSGPPVSSTIINERR